MKNINYFFQAILIYFFFIIGRILGIRLSRLIFSNLFFYIGPYFKSKKILKKNLDISFPKFSNHRIKEIEKNMWKNYGMTFIEYIFLNYYRKNKSHMLIDGKTNLFNLIQKNKPVIFISGHFANFELMSMEITKNKINLATIYRPLNNIFLNPFMKYLEKKKILKNKKKKKKFFFEKNFLKKKKKKKGKTKFKEKKN